MATETKVLTYSFEDSPELLTSMAHHETKVLSSFFLSQDKSCQLQVINDSEVYLFQVFGPNQSFYIRHIQVNSESVVQIDSLRSSKDGDSKEKILDGKREEEGSRSQLLSIPENIHHSCNESSKKRNDLVPKVISSESPTFLILKKSNLKFLIISLHFYYVRKSNSSLSLLNQKEVFTEIASIIHYSRSDKTNEQRRLAQELREKLMSRSMVTDEEYKMMMAISESFDVLKHSENVHEAHVQIATLANSILVGGSDVEESKLQRIKILSCELETKKKKKEGHQTHFFSLNLRS